MSVECQFCGRELDRGPGQAPICAGCSVARKALLDVLTAERDAAIASEREACAARLEMALACSPDKPTPEDVTLMAMAISRAYALLADLHGEASIRARGSK